MNATRLKGQITADRRLIIEQVPKDLSPGVVEVIVLQEPKKKLTNRRARGTKRHPAFGIWADRTDIVSSADYAALLRSRLESRTNGDG